MRSSLNPRFRLAVVCTSLISAALLVPESVHGTTDISLMTWNINRAIGAGTNADNAAAEAIGRVVNYFQPDVFMFNEVLSRSNNSPQSTANVNAALQNWIVANVPYLATSTFYTVVATNSDGFIRNAIISRYPIVSVTNYNDGLRGLLRGVIDLPGTTNDLAIFDAHLKAFGDLLSSSQRQAEANFDANIIRNWLAGTNLTTVFAGDWNEDESNPQFPIGSNIGIGAYAPISTNIGAGFYNWIAYDTNSLVSNQTLSIRGDLDARFDYLLPATGRFNSIDGFVFNSYTWYSLGILPGALYQDDSSIASDHLPIYARLDFGSSVPEPSILLMSALGSFIVIGYRRHRKRTKKPAA